MERGWPCKTLLNALSSLFLFFSPLPMHKWEWLSGTLEDVCLQQNFASWVVACALWKLNLKTRATTKQVWNCLQDSFFMTKNTVSRVLFWINCFSNPLLFYDSWNCLTGCQHTWTTKWFLHLILWSDLCFEINCLLNKISSLDFLMTYICEFWEREVSVAGNSEITKGKMLWLFFLLL